MYGQREKVLARLLRFLRNHGAQHRGVFDGHQDSAARLAGDTSGFQSDCLATVLKCFSYWIHDYSPILNMTPGRSHERPGIGV